MKLERILVLLGIAILLYVGFQKISPDFSVHKKPATEYNTKVLDNQKNNIDMSQYSRALFERVVDGDTIIINLKGERERVRLIGIDTPESVRKGYRVECFGKESSRFLESLLRKQKYVYLEFDPASGKRGRNGRILAHIFLADGTNVNQKIIADGYGYEYTYRGQNYLHKSDYKKAQKVAEKNQYGLWSPDTCGGQI